MKYFKFFSILIWGFPIVVSAQLDGVDYDWKQKKNKKGITVSISSVDGSSYNALRAEMVVDAEVAQLVALVEDMAACPDWAAMCKEARVEKRISDTESFVYTYNKIPFPVSDRDVYAHVVWTQDPKTMRVSMTSTATKGGTAKTNAVRDEKAVTQWHFTPNDDGTTIVENFAHFDPNGPIPAMIANLMMINAPYKTLIRMRKIVESGGYADSEIPFLDKP